MVNSILIGEDNFVAQKILVTRLEGKCSKIVVVSTAAEILKALNEHQFDLLLLDYHLDRDADFIIERIIESDLGYNIPIYVISAESESSITEKLKGLKFDGYLPKSATEAELDGVLSTVANLASSTTNSNAATGIVDLTNLEKLLGNNPKKLKRIVSIFIDDATAQLVRMEELLLNENFVELKKVVHRVKASYGYLGLHTVTRQLTDWELSLDNQNDTHLHNDSFGKIKKDVNNIIDELTKNYSSIVDLSKPSRKS